MLVGFLFSNFSIGQDFILQNNTPPNPQASTSFLQSFPYPASVLTLSQLDVGKGYENNLTRGVFYGGNLGVSQHTYNFGQPLGKWSFIGGWKIYKSTLWGTPGQNYLVNYHRWGDYSAHFGLRTAYIYSDDAFSPADAAKKDAVISWGYEHGKTENRLIFQSIEGVDASGSTYMTETEWATILSNGNIGSGTPTPNAQFQLKPLSSSATTPMFEILDFSNNSKLIFKSDRLGLSVSNPTEVLDVLGNFKLNGNQNITGNYAQTGNMAVTGNANIAGSTFLDGFLTIRGNTSAGIIPLTITDNATAPNNLFIVDHLGDVRIPNGDLYLPSITGTGAFPRILTINATGQVVSGPAPTANTLWEMGANNLTSNGIIGSLTNFDIEFHTGNVSTTPVVAYKVHGVNSTYRGFTEFNKPMAICTTANDFWTLNLKSAGTITGVQGVLNCVSTTGASILKVDNGGNMYLPGIAPSGSGQSFVGIDAYGQLTAMMSNTGYWASAGNTFTGTGATYTFGSLGTANDKIEFFAGGNKVFDTWTSTSATTAEGSTNFCRNVSIQGGSTSTYYPNGNGGFAPTSNCNNTYYSLNLRSAIDPTHPNYDDKGILRCTDGNNNEIMTMGAKAISLFSNTTIFDISIGWDRFHLMNQATVGSNILIIRGKTKVKHHILPDKSITVPIINLGGTGTGEQFDNIYGTNLECSTIASSSIYNSGTIQTNLLLPTSTVSNIGASGNEFNQIWGNDIHAENLIPITPCITTSCTSGSSIGSSLAWWYEVTTQISTVMSDKRLKENIEPLKYGLNTILSLKPYTYNFKSKKNEFHHGFMAQELKEIFQNSIVRGKETDTSCMGVIYDEFVPILTLAIQEQQAIIEAQKASIDSLKEKLNLVFASNTIIENKNITAQKEVLNRVPLLFQNHPNPFNGFTFIDYFLPDNVSDAFLRVIDSNGKLVKAFPINKTGFGQIELDCRNLSSGQYHYSLLVNSQIVDTKSMLIAEAN